MMRPCQFHEPICTKFIYNTICGVYITRCFLFLSFFHWGWVVRGHLSQLRPNPPPAASVKSNQIKSKLLVAAAVVVADAALAVAMQKDPEQGGVEHGVEDPGADAAAPAGDGAAEVHPDDAGVAHEVAPQQGHLAGERDARRGGGAHGA